MCVLAGAGTGKTRAITHRIAYGVHSGAFQPQRVLAVTFTARAAGEMRTRLRDLGVAGVQARTFHSAALRQLHFFWPQAVGGAAPEVMSQKASAVAQAAASLRLDLARDRTAIRDLAAEIEWAKVSMLTPETYVAGARAARREPPGLDVTAMARLLEAYEQTKTARGVIDFEDVLLLTVGILAERDDIARAVRAQYRHFVVDEYQDVSALQQRLLDLWVGERDDVCVVGDPAQTIYSFTGASPRHLLEFTGRHPGARTVRLVRNYRSSPQIVSLANLVVRGPSGSMRSNAVQLQAQGGDGPSPALTAHPDDPAEAGAVAAEIAERVGKGVPPSQMAVLFRTNGQSEVFESALADAGIPYLVRGGERFFSRSEVRDAVLLMRGARLRCQSWSATCWSAPGGRARRPGRAEPPASGGSRWQRWLRCPTTWPRPRPRHDCLTSCASSTSGRRRSTRPPCRA
jgi:DNA helicase-2/ATP-dependent DNA helicase PcrA